MEPLFTVITDVYYGLPYFKETVESIINQTYKNLEIIISNNGGDASVCSYVNEITKMDSRIVLITYKTNIFNIDDPCLGITTLGNKALEFATGDYILYTSYDDPLSLDYVERMVKLFTNNPNCTSAAGRSVSIDFNGSVNETELYHRENNFRQVYIPGHELALSYLRDEYRVFAEPGTIFSIRRDVFQKYDGFFLKAMELSHLYGLVPFGETGFDEDAIYYWRRHSTQLNLDLTDRGVLGYNDTLDMINDINLYKRWSIYGEDVAQYVVDKIMENARNSVLSHAVMNLCNWRIKAFRKNASYAVSYSQFWGDLSEEFFVKSPGRLLYMIKKPVVEIAKNLIRLLDKIKPEYKIKSSLFKILVSRATPQKEQLFYNGPNYKTVKNQM